MFLNNLILHGGLHKTGTTFLQESVFCNLSDITFIGKPWKDDTILKILNEIYTANDIDINEELMKNRFQQYLADDLKSNNPNVLLSSEGLFSGYDWFGRNHVNMLKIIRYVKPNFIDPSDTPKKPYLNPSII